MPTEPNRNIDDELRAYAATRRAAAGSPFELHPVSRKTLQDEVARTLRPEAPKFSSGRSVAWWLPLWPKLALATAAVLAVGLGLVQFAHRRPQVLLELAKTERSMEAPTVPAEQPAPLSQTPAVPPLADASPPSSSAKPALKEEADGSRRSPAPARRLAADKSTSPDGPATTTQNASPTFAAAPPRQQDALAGPAPAVEVGGGPSPSGLMRQRYGVVARRQDGPALRRETNAPAPVRVEAPPMARMAEARAVAVDATVVGPARSAAGEPPDPRKASKAPSAALVAPTARPALAPSSLLVQETGSDNGPGLGGAVVSSDLGRASTETGQRFAQTGAYRRNFNSPPKPGVLQSFSLRRDQQQVVVIDADGSVYQGWVVPGPGGGTPQTPAQPAVVATASVRSQSSAAGRPAQAPAVGTATTGEQSVSFVVTGTNVTLNQRVTFEGQMIPGTNHLSGLDGGMGAEVQAPSEPGPGLLRSASGTAGAGSGAGATMGLSVQGQATVGDAVRIEIRAVRAPP
jgi:hypothetical protein